MAEDSNYTLYACGWLKAATATAYSLKVDSQECDPGTVVVVVVELLLFLLLLFSFCFFVVVVVVFLAH